MKYRALCLLFLLTLVTSLPLCAQSNTEVVDLKKHKVVIQFNEGDSVSQVRVTLQVQNIRALLPNADIEVVCLGGGLDLLVAATSKAPAAVADWSAKGVTFAACNNTMRNRNIKKESLLPQAQVVPAALVELTLKQEQGYAFVRGGK